MWLQLFRLMTLASMLPVAALAQTAASSKDFLVQRFELHFEREQGSFLKKTLKEMNSAEGKALINTVGGMVGIPPGTLAAAIAAAEVANSAVKNSQKGDENRWSWTFPEGYLYCRASVRIESIVPGSGDGKSTLSIKTNEEKVYAYSYTRQRRGGRSWAKADVTVVLVKEDSDSDLIAEADCREPGYLVICEGNKCRRPRQRDRD